MRIINTIKNSYYGFVTYFLQIVLTLFVRKAFLSFLTIELLGYEGLFSSIFTIMSIADLGSATFISYRLYSAVAIDDKDKINQLLSIYRKIYCFTAKATILVGLVISLFLKIIIKGSSYNWDYVYTVYFLQLISIVLNYFLSYARIVFICYQKENENIKIDFAVNCISSIVRIIVLVLYKSYVLYLIVKVVETVVANLLIKNKVYKEYKWIKTNEPFNFNVLKELGIINDIKNGILTNIAGIVYFSTDNIVISSIVGITDVGLIYNYSTITNQVSNVINKITNPFQSSIANYVNSENRIKGNQLFHMFDKISFIIASFVFTSIICLINPFIEIVFGSEKLLNYFFVFIISFDLYISINHMFVLKFRYCFGKYELDRNSILFAAVINLLLSFILAPQYGVVGVKFATLIGQLGFWYGRVKVLYNTYIYEKTSHYFFKQILNILILFVESSICFIICNIISNNIFGFILKCFICVLIPNIINLALNLNTNEYKLFIEYAFKTKNEISNKYKTEKIIGH